MWAIEQLVGSLSKVFDLVLGCLANGGVLDAVNVHASRVGQVVEHIVALLRCLAALLVAEDQINPLVNVVAHIVANVHRGAVCC